MALINVRYLTIQELTEMMSECDNFTPDTTAQRSDVNTIKLYLMSRFAPVLKGKNIDKLN